MTKITFDLSNLPNDVALFLSQQTHTALLADGLAGSMRLSAVGRDLLHRELLGTVAGLVDGYLEQFTAPNT